MKKVRLYKWMLPGKTINTVNGEITNREWLENEVKRINCADPLRQAVIVRSKDWKISIAAFEHLDTFHPTKGSDYRQNEQVQTQKAGI